MAHFQQLSSPELAVRPDQPAPQQVGTPDFNPKIARILKLEKSDSLPKEYQWRVDKLRANGKFPDALSVPFGYKSMRKRQEAFKDMPFIFPRADVAALKAIRSTILGVTSLLPGPLSEDLRGAIPEIATTGAEDIEATLLQFGVPAIGGAKYAAGLVRGTGKIVKLAKNLAGMGGAAATDFAVADVDKEDFATAANALNDAYGLNLPTAINKYDPSYVKRGKTAVEGVVAAGGLQVVGKGLGLLARPIAWIASKAKAAGDKLGPVFLGRYGGRKEVTRAIVESISDKEATLKELDDLISKSEGESYQTRASGELSKVTEDTVSPYAATEFAEETIGAQRGAVKAQVDTVADALNAAKSDLDVMAREVDTGGAKMRGSTASAELSEQITDTELRMMNKKNKLAEAIDPNRKEIIDREEGLVDLVKEIRRTAAKEDIPLGKYWKRWDSFKKRAIGTDKVVETPSGPVTIKQKPISLGEIESFRPSLSEALGRAMRANKGVGDGAAVRELMKIKNFMAETVEDLSQLPTPAGERAAEFLRFYREEFAPIWRQGIGAKLSKARKRGEVLPTQVAKQFKPGVRENMEDLERIVSQTQDPAKAEGLIREFVVSEFASVFVRDGRFVSGAVDTFLKNNAELLSKYPKIQGALADLARPFRNKEKLVSDLGKALEEAQSLERSIEQDIKAVAKLYLNKDPATAMRGALDGPDPIKDLRRMVNFANKDTTGRALQGLRAGLSEYIDTAVRGADYIPGAGGVKDISLKSLEKLLDTKRWIEAVEKSGLYSKLDLERLERTRGILRFEQDVIKKTIGISPQKQVAEMEAKGRTIISSFYNLIQGRGVTEIFKNARNTVTGNPGVAANELIDAVRYDMKLLQLMLRKATSKNEKAMSEFLKANYPKYWKETPPAPSPRAYVAPNVLAEYGDQP